MGKVSQDQVGVAAEIGNFDTILWQDESDKFSKRAIKAFKDLETLFNRPERKAYISELVKELNRIPFFPKRILDIGCGTGGFLKLLNDAYPRAELFGVDPGEYSLDLARQYFCQKQIKVNFYIGHSHALENKTASVDLVTLFKVLQWVPRAFLMSTIAEVDRVLEPGGCLVINDFLPQTPLYRQSKHNKSVYIFKQDYPKLFEAFPWYEIIYENIRHMEKGEDFTEHLVILRKKRIQTAYSHVPMDDV